MAFSAKGAEVSTEPSNPNMFTNDHSTNRMGQNSDYPNPLDKLHMRFGHQSVELIMKGLKHEEIKRLKQYKLNPCVVCDLVKIVQFPLGKTINPAESVLQRIHTDIFPLEPD